MENETTAYQWIDDYDIGPRFLGHLTEEGRAIGFLMERIPAERHAGPQDLESCQEALSRLHDLGIRHGDINRFNFLICQSKAVLIDFDTAQKCDNRDLLLEELEDLSLRLNDPSNRGGGGIL
jgi:predicted Ser/Thr protein kinase